MRRDLLPLLCDPETGEDLSLTVEEENDGHVIRGWLTTPSGRRWPIVDRVPRFVDPALYESVRSFGDQWNHFNFDDFREHWLQHTVANTFGDAEAFRDKVIVDAGGGSGAQSLWMLESGAARVILLELSHSVDDVIGRNIDPARFPNFDAIQCSIDRPPLRPGSIDGMVICHNVIQHTPSVERTARALWALVAPGGEFVFNCYRRGRPSMMGWIRENLTAGPLRRLLSRAPFPVILAYARVMGAVRLVPILGWLTNKLRLSLTGRLPKVAGESWLDRKRRIYRATVLNTFDNFGAHAHQHYLSESEQRALISALQPDPEKAANLEPYFESPQPTGCAVRLRR
jgi:SAM-dependent methyltransferase